MKENTLPTKECDVCGKTFIKFRIGQVVCDWKCAAKQQKEKRKQQELAEKAQRAADKARKKELDPKRKKKALAAAKKALHAFIRARDEGKSCISCDTILIASGKLGGDFDAGHFRSVGSAKHMEFVEKNIHGQCKRCNLSLSGNAVEYEKGLIQRYGQEYVDALKSDNTVRKLTIDDYETIGKLYRLKLKDLLAARAEGQDV